MLPTYLYLHQHLPTPSYIHLHLPTYTYTDLLTPTPTYLHLHLATYTYILTPTYLHLHTYLHLATCTYSSTYLHTYASYLPTPTPSTVSHHNPHRPRYHGYPPACLARRRHGRTWHTRCRINGQSGDGSYGITYCNQPRHWLHRINPMLPIESVTREALQIMLFVRVTKRHRCVVIVNT